MKTESITLLLNLMAIACVILVFLAFKYGYRKAERDRLKEQKRIWKEQQDQLPKAIGSVRTFKKSSYR